MPFLLEAFGPGADREAAPARAVIGRPQMTLLAALRSEVGLALWLRDLPAGWNRGIRPLLEAGAFRAVGEGSPGEAIDQAAAVLPASAPVDLLADALHLAELFTALSRSPRLRLRIDGITGDACRKFHVDAVGFRLLVTYAGPGTQWTLADPAAPGTTIHEVPAGAVAVLRGRARPGGHVPHRSPPLSHLPEARRRRLVLCLDEPEAP